MTETNQNEKAATAPFKWRHVAITDKSWQAISRPDGLMRLLVDNGIDMKRPIEHVRPYDRSVHVYFNTMIDAEIANGYVVDEVVI